MTVCEIIPNLWLGDINIARNKNFFDENNIDIVINCSKDIEFFCNYTKNIRISVDDNLEECEIEKFYEYIEKAVDFIHDEILNNKNILVHCYAGRQRSASIVACYLIKYGKIKYKEAIESIKTKRELAFTPEINFEKSIIKFEKKIFSI